MVNLVDHLSVLEYFVVKCLQSMTDLVDLGLRTLEFWIDNLSVEYLIAQLNRDKRLFHELMVSLCALLKNNKVSTHNALGIRVVGKVN